jgi:hypothetical protein
VLIKNVLPHPDDLHDGRAIGAYETADVSPKDFELEHYQSRLRDGCLVVAEPDETDENTSKRAPKGASKETV